MAGEKLVSRATTAERSGRAQDAIAIYLQAIAADPRNLVAYTRLGNLLHRNGHPADALRSYRRALELKPNDIALLHRCIGAAITAIDLSAAGQHLQQLLTLQPRDQPGLMYVGELLEMQGELEKAQAWYRAMAASVPRSHQRQERLDRLALIRNRLAQSQDRYRAALGDAEAPATGPAKTHFVTFGTASYSERQDFVGRTAVAFADIDGVVAWNEKTLAATPHYEQCKPILGERRGAGFYAWKPLIILAQLERVRDGDWVVYSDIGRAMPYAIYHRIDPLRIWALASNGGLFPGVYIPDCGPNRRWTKRDCFVRMGCDSAYFWDQPQLQASFSLWQKNAASVAFVRQWLQFACDRAVITDDPNVCGLANLPEFIDHRHDQSVLTNLALKLEITGFGRRDTPIACNQAMQQIDFVAANFDSLIRKQRTRRDPPPSSL